LGPHRNAGIEICYIREGCYRWQVEGRSYQLESGDGFVTMPWQEHGGEHGVLHRGNVDYVVIGLDRCGVGGRWRWGKWNTMDRITRLYVERHLLRGSSPQLSGAQELGPLFDRLWYERQSIRPGAASLIHALLGELLLVAARLTERGQTIQKITENRFARVLSELAAQPEQPWTLAGMALRAGLKRTRFSELMRDHVGCSPLRHLERLRMEQARRLLGRNLPVTEVAHACGYSSSQAFATAFKRDSGITASEFRRRATE
jgi:AraC family L-rhamnose operon regulatory protein RhaS